MSWRARPICMRCQRIIHGPGAGVVGPTQRFVYPDDYRGLRCSLCGFMASPHNIMRLWADEDEPDEGLEFV